MRERLRTLIQGLSEVFSRPGYLVTAAAVFAFSLLLTIWLKNWALLGDVLFGREFDLRAKIMVLLTSYGNVMTDMHGVERVTTLTVLALFAVNVAVLAYYFRRRLAFDKAAGTGLVGTVLGALGIGCSSCGSVILAALLGTTATASVVGFLPLHGAEFGILGSVLLVVSIYLTLKKITSPEVCKPKGA